MKLELRNISIEYQKKKSFYGKDSFLAVKDVSLFLKDKEILSIVGESGSGKSSIARAISTLHPQSKGEILLKGVSYENLDRKEILKNIQMIFQDPYSSLNPRMKVIDIISEPMLNFKICDKKTAINNAMDLLKQVGLEADDANKYPHAFSGGQRQRVAIARALSINPSILIADEAVSALDVSIQAKILDLLKKLRDEKNISILFISHDLSVVKEISDRVAVMKDGKIVELGTVDEIYNNPKEEYTKKLLNSVPKIPKQHH